MTAVDFNKIDKYNDKTVALDALSYHEKIVLLEEQIHTIYNIWHNSSQKINLTMVGYNTADRSEVKVKEQIFYYDNLLSQAVWTNRKINYPNAMPLRVLQWGIFYCDLGFNVGSEQNKRRPVLILNDTSYINSNVVLVAPITGNGKKVYKHEVQLLETAYSKVTGKVDLSHIRSVSKSRLDPTPVDRLLNASEYSNKYKGKTYTMLQDTISRKIKIIFGIVI